ncbi:MAG: MBL fold metallo-hydrolase [Chloroflexi bacterium]|nr:MBL fold metallo-hydrolase [Chloroflexota bacterium]
MQELAPGVFVETGFRRVNVGAILTDDGFVLIDTPPYPEDALRWRRMLELEAALPILAIVNTDFHRDRVLGNCWFDAGVIVGHDETIEHLKNLPSSYVDSAVEALTAGNPLERSAFAGARLCLPSLGFSHRMQLRFGRRPIPLLAMPGPTLGSLWIHLPEHRLVFAGDAVVVDQHPYISSSTTKQWLESLTILRRIRFPVETIVPGRGPLVGKNATEPLSNYLRLARRRVHSLYRAGRPRADTSALVSELIEFFPYQQDDTERVQRRIKSGLDRIYEEFKSGDKSNNAGR